MSHLLAPRALEIRHFHIFCGLGGGAQGFNHGQAKVGHTHADFRCIGGIDSDRRAIADFTRLARVDGTVLDLFSREQYEAFHGHEPPDNWREATVDDVRRAAHGERPHLVFGSAPCKGFSGLLSKSRSQSVRYQALNQLALRGLWLCLEAWADDPPEFILWENVPRMATRGRAVLDGMIQLAEAYGYVGAETVHDCGEIGELGQSRKRLLVVFRHRQKVPPFLYEPRRRPLRSVGEVIGKAPRPGDPAAGPMHRMRSLQWRTWVRLAFVEAGSDWRSLKRLRVVDGRLADFGLVPDAAWHRGVLGVTPWEQASCTVTGRAGSTTGRFNVADPLPTYTGDYHQLGVCRWDRPTGTVSGQSAPGGGAYSIADPQIDGPARYNNCYRIVPFDRPSPAVTGGGGPAGGLAVADPRWLRGDHPRHGRGGLYGVVRFDQHSATIIGKASHDTGAFCVADPSLTDRPGRHLNQWRVDGWDRPAHTIIGATRPGIGALCVADPHISTSDADTARASLPAADDRLVAVIRALDGTWHRPFTTFELALLQGLIDPDEGIAFDGTSDSGWRERIGNAVPSPAAAAIASVMGETLLLAWAGETFQLSASPIWVRSMAVAVAVDQGAAS